MNLLHADAGGLRTRLEQPGIGNAGHEFAKTVVIEDMDEFGNEDAGFAGARAHGELVAKVAEGGEAHAGTAGTLAGDTEIAETARRAAPRPLRCARRLRRAHSASRDRASSLFRGARRGIFRLPARCAGLRACRYPARCAGGAPRLLLSRNGGSHAGSTRRTARARRFFQKCANA